MGLETDAEVEVETVKGKRRKKQRRIREAVTTVESKRNTSGRGR